MRQFLWKGEIEGRSLNLVSWKNIVTPKQYGGLGVRDSQCVNIALLGKLIWQIFFHQDKFWVQTFWAIFWLDLAQLQYLHFYEWDCLSSKSIWHRFGFNSARFFHILQIVDCAYPRNSCKEFLDAFRVYSSAANPTPLCEWETPMSGWYKVNCDVSFMFDKACAGFACIIRNSEGLCVKGCHGGLPMSSVLRGELHAIWRCLVLAWEAGIRNIICESDYLEGVLLLHSVNDAGNTMDRDITAKILELLSRDWNVSISAVLRSANPYMEWFVPTAEVLQHLDRDKHALIVAC
ncbi:hypothetical protein PIB30_078212 [Stylosanthes scabra]|uniref:RNase H type-1 domain-containing protein n=1 Tax=Stylosanthes scabra TaxID=79078 RepID=A0ABU6RQS0_9FABA|nr:hypothetical protein [Stylosanthes scabra]